MDSLTDHQTPKYETDKDGRRKLEPGMLLLTDDDKWPKLYTVSKVNKTNAHIVAHHGTMHEDATLSRPYLPDGWRVMPNRELAAFCHTVVKVEAAALRHAAAKGDGEDGSGD